MDAAAKYQAQLLDQSRRIYHQTPISDATAQAYLATPRHEFVHRYRQRGAGWCEVGEANLAQHLATIYTDTSLVLYGDDDDNVPSTISQPSFVLRMLDLLQLAPGQRVLELGAGSGWNAALIARLVGPSGSVVSLEIIPELAQGAAEAIARQGLTNVRIVTADGGDGYAAGGPYDRVTFTAGAYDLPGAFHDQVKDGGLLLAVIKNAGGSDNLFLLRKVRDHFESLYSTSCGFVPMTGKHRNEAFDPVVLEDLPEWTQLRGREISRRPFWWGAKGREHFAWNTTGIRSFLAITEPWFLAFKSARAAKGSQEEHFFGLWDRVGGSLALARDEELISYGDARATDRLLDAAHLWVNLGMPAAASFGLQVFKRDQQITPRENQWVVERPESRFLWSLHDTRTSFV